nr:NAD(P)/FAD-dependent oxidoreductase [Oceanococcus sp. HetDA_MAG_MS8]
MQKKQVVIVGGGFGGLFCARALGRKANVEVTLIDKRNFHLFQPLLYQVATGILTVGDISTQQRVVLRRYKNVRTIMATCYDIDVEAQVVRHDRGTTPYDELIVATGVKHQYFGNDHWRAYAPGLKTIEHALDMRHRIFRAFEMAETETDPDRRRRLLNFIVIGAGPTGVELAGALGELAHRTMLGDFRAINTADANITLLEGAPAVLPVYPADLQTKAQRYLEDLGVTVRTGTRVEDVAAGRVHVRNADDSTDVIEAETILWAAGVEVSAFGRILAKRTQATTDRGGRLLVDEKLRLPSHPNITVVGDLACFQPDNSERPLPGLAPVAIQQGRYVAKRIHREMQNKSVPAFRYLDKGSMAIVGRHRVVGTVGRYKLTGFSAWATWALVHIWALIEPGQRMSVSLQWMWRSLGRTADRLITGNPPKTSDVLKARGIDPATLEKAS